MVLEGATRPRAAEDDGFSSPGDAGFNQDEQQDGGTREEYHVDIARLPRPFGLFLDLPTWDTPGRKEILLMSLARSREVVGRPLRQEEVDALSWKFANELTVISYCIPSGIVGAALWTFRTRHHFLKQITKRGYSPDRFLFMRGKIARTAWLGSRMALGSTIGIGMNALFWSLVARSQDIKFTMTDPRLGDYRSALSARAKLQGKGGQLKSTPVQQGSIESQGGMMDHAAVKANRRLEEARMRSQTGVASQRTRSGSAYPATRDEDDMSPTGVAFQDDFLGEEQDFGLMSDDQLQRNERRQQSSTQSQQPVARATDTAGQSSQRVAQQQRGDTAVQTGGVWERLRREAASGIGDVKQQGPMQGSQQGPRRGATDDESFTYSSADAERQFARSEAQRDFDARVEKERRGGDFDQSRDRKW